MRSIAKCLTACICFAFPSYSEEVAPEQTASAPQESSFKAFTGKISRNKVRLRLHPGLESTVVKELQRGDLLVVIGETDEFYTVNPPEDLKAYVFRTFILDNIVEGNHVNVRLAPDLEAPVIAQLNNGDHVSGIISSANNKWLEILPPKDVKFYVSKEYVETAGDVNFMALMQKRRNEVNLLLSSAYESGQEELKKPFEEIDLQASFDKYKTILSRYADFPGQAARAKELMEEAQQNYLQKKLAYLEAKALQADEFKSKQPREEEKQIEPPISFQTAPAQPKQRLSEKMAAWLPVETTYYRDWLVNHPGNTIEEFYAQQNHKSVILTGVVEPYMRHIRNKPGDYILVSKHTKLPVAYLYSTMVDLGRISGKEVTLIAIPRPNHDFAYPAYFIYAVE